MPRPRLREQLPIGQIDLERRQRDPVLLHRPSVRPQFGVFDWLHGKPEQRASQRILCGNDPAIVVPDRDAGPDEATRLATGEEYDVIVLDLNLPRRDGISVLREVRAKKKKGDEVPEVTYAQKRGKYQDQRGVTLPRM